MYEKKGIEVLQAERVAIADEAKDYMQEMLDKYGTGISVQLVQLQGVVPPEPVSDSFNEVNRAKQDQETLINEAKQSYNKQIYKIEGEAQKIKVTFWMLGEYGMGARGAVLPHPSTLPLTPHSPLI